MSARLVVVPVLDPPTSPAPTVRVALKPGWADPALDLLAPKSPERFVERLPAMLANQQRRFRTVDRHRCLPPLPQTESRSPKFIVGSRWVAHPPWVAV